MNEQLELFPEMNYGPTVPLSEETHAEKYRGDGESFKDAMSRVANGLKDNDEHFLKMKDILYNMRFLPAGRVQAAIGAPKVVTPYNCFVMDTIPDSMEGIMRVASEAAETMRQGGGVGYDFSTLRPRGANITTLDSESSGPLAFMDVYDALCRTILSAGHRRGAQMGVMRVDHPDIEEFIRAKQNDNRLTNFNISVGVTDEFMLAVLNDLPFELKFGGVVYKTVSAKNLWEEIMRVNWDWAEPGVLFLDTMNRKNNLWYCEIIAATNPCGEQPLPPYGACLLGSFNATKYVKPVSFVKTAAVPFAQMETRYTFDYEAFKHDIPHIVRAMDNVVDRAVYPLVQQMEEAKSKRRMGLGVTGLANAMEICGIKYGTEEAKEFTESVLSTLRDCAYLSSVELAIEKGPFPLWDKRLLDSEFALTLPEEVREKIREHGLRNSHLLSIAPTGTISLTADNISSGIEPVFMHEFSRKIASFDGSKEEVIQDYAYRNYGVQGVTAGELTGAQHVDMLVTASKFVDSACSKTCNLAEDVSWTDFKNVYMAAWLGGASGCTTYRNGCKRSGILTEAPQEGEGTACYFDPETGQKSCE